MYFCKGFYYPLFPLRVYSFSITESVLVDWYSLSRSKIVSLRDSIPFRAATSRALASRCTRSPSLGSRFCEGVVVASLAMDKLARGLATSVWSWPAYCSWTDSLDWWVQSLLSHHLAARCNLQRPPPTWATTFAQRFL